MTASDPSPTTAKAMVEAALAAVRTLTVAEARALAQAGVVRWVDVREPEEWARTGCLPAAVRVPRGLLEFAFDPTSPWHRPECVAAPGEMWVLYCGIGWRSALAALALQRLGIQPVAHLEGGIQAWVAGGGTTEPWASGAA